MSSSRSNRFLTALIFVALALCGTIGQAQPWATKPQLPQGLHGHVAAVTEDTSGQELLFVFGGGGDSTLFSRNDVFDGTSWDSSSYAPLPTPRRFATETVAHDRKIWVIGGSSGGNPALDTVEVYDPSGPPGVWTTVSPLLTGRSEAAAATGPNGRIFVFGGVSANGNKLASVEMYDPANPGWVTRAPMPEPHQRLGAELGCDGLIYVMGRNVGLNHTQSINFAYDPIGDTWLPIGAKTPHPVALTDSNALGGRGMTVGPDGRIYMVNDGWFNTNSDPRVFSYDPLNDSWRVEPSSNRGYTSPAAATYAGEVYAIGGVARFPPIDTRRVEALGPIAENSPCDPQCSEPPPGMVSWLSFDERAGSVAADQIAGRNGAHLDQPQPQPVPGKVAGALHMTGSVIVPHHPTLGFSDGDFSIDLWMLDPTPGAVVGKYDGQSGRGYELFLDHVTSFPELDVGIVLNGSSHVFSACAIPDDSAWHHLALVVDRAAGQLLCYLDGFLRDMTPILDSASVNNAASLLVATGVARPSGSLVVVDELELFPRMLTAQEVQAIFGAGGEGKCKSSVHLPWDQGFCLNTNQIIAQMDVCNFSTVTKNYLLSFQFLPAGSTVSGGSCDIDGPVNYEDVISGNPVPPAIAVSVNAGSCPQIPIRIDRPADMNAAFEVGCYQAYITDVATGGTAIATGSVQDRRDLCALIGGGSSGGGAGTRIARVGEPLVTELEIFNTSGIQASANVLIEAMTSDDSIERDVISLNGQDPGTPVTVALSIPEGGSVTIPLNLTYTRSDPGFQEVVAWTMHEPDALLVPLTSMALRPPVPGDATTGAQLGDTIWLDADGDGFRDGGEDGLAGVSVLLIDSGGKIVASVETDHQGTYYFLDVAVGSYFVRIDRDTLPKAAELTFDPDGVFDHQTAVDAGGGETHAGLDFGYKIALNPTIFTDDFESGDTSAWSQ